MALWKWLLLLLAGLAIFFVFLKSKPALNESNRATLVESEIAELIEQGNFTISIQTTKIGEEQFSFTRAGDQFILSSEVSLGLLGQSFQYSQLTELNSDLESQSYELTALLPQGNQVTTTHFYVDRAEIGLEAEGVIENYKKEGHAPWYVADSNIGSHYYLIYYIVRNRKDLSGPFAGTVIVPQTMEVFSLQLESTGPAKLRVQGNEIEVTRYAFMMGELQFALYGKEDTFYVAELISQQTMAYRSDLLESQPEIIYQP